MDRVSRDTSKKTYDYFSRYSQLTTYYNNLDKKRYYETGYQLSKNISTYIKHEVGVNDSLDAIALKYYGNPLYWWIIADMNNIQDPFSLVQRTVLLVPYLNEIKFN